MNKAHGRLETRTLSCTDELDDSLTWPGVRQVLRRETERVHLQTGEVTRAVTYAVTSLLRSQATPEQLAAVGRGHWTTENRCHSVREVTLGEDACQLHVGAAPKRSPPSSACCGGQGGGTLPPGCGITARR